MKITSKLEKGLLITLLNSKGAQRRREYVTRAVEGLRRKELLKIVRLPNGLDGIELTVYGKQVAEGLAKK